MYYKTELQSHAPTQRIFHTLLTTSIAPHQMHCTPKSHTGSVILTVTLKHKSWFNCYHIQSGQFTATQKRKAMDGLAIRVLGYLMLAHCQIDFIFTRSFSPEPLYLFFPLQLTPS